MRYPAQSDLWKYNWGQNQKGRSITQIGKSRVLYRVKQVFPVVLFPSEVIVEELRIIWLRQFGPWASEVLSIMATDIASVNAASGLLFGNIHIKSLTGGPEIVVDNLHRRDVFQLRGLVEGIALSAREGLKIEEDNLESERSFLLRAGQVKDLN